MSATKKESITKKELKIRLEIIGMNLTQFLEELEYNPKHLSRYKLDSFIPYHFYIALLYFEENKSKEKLFEIIDEYKKISLQTIEDETIKEVGENCFFWDKNAKFLVVGELEEKTDSGFKIKDCNHNFDFISKFVGMTPRKFFVQHFSNGKVVKAKEFL